MDKKESDIYILIIDDRQSELWFMERILQKLGYEVRGAIDGFDGLTRLKERIPDLIILDTIMPRMDGYKVFQSLVNSPDTAGIPVIILTDKGEPYERNKLSILTRSVSSQVKKSQPVTTGKLVFLNKPIISEELAARVESLVASCKTPAPAVQSTDSRPRVLIIDDDFNLVQAMNRALEENDVGVAVAYNGLEGINRLRDETPDMIILDTIMPHLNGLQVLQYLNQHSKVPVMMIPGQAEADLLQKALVSGAESYLIKPFALDDMVAFVKRKLKAPRIGVVP
jgi:DNA-binding response OmpR family regulator